MKFDDKKIISDVKQDSNYKIKTTSSNILKVYQLEKNKEEAKVNNSKRKLFIFGGIGGLGVVCAAAAAAIIVVNSNAGSSNDNQFIEGITIENTILTEELATFSYFNTNNESTTLSKIKLARQNRNEEENLTQEHFNDICKTYDDVEFAIESLSNEVSVKGYEFNQEKEGTYYKYVNFLYVNDNDTPFASLYFNDSKIVEDDDEIETRFLALYELDGKYSDLTIVKEVENEEDEAETSYNLIFYPRDDDDYLYKIEKESEIKGIESEEAYSYAIYDKKNDECLYKITYEVEKEFGEEAIELEIEKIDSEYSYEDIKIKGDTTTFIASMEKEDVEVEDVYVTLKKENGAKRYTSKNGLIYNS